MSILVLNKLRPLILIFISMLLLGEVMPFPCTMLGVVGARFLVMVGAGGDDKDGTDLGVGSDVDRCLSACRTGDGTGCNGMRPNASQGFWRLVLGEKTPAGELRYR